MPSSHWYRSAVGSQPNDLLCCCVRQTCRHTPLWKNKSPDRNHHPFQTIRWCPIGNSPATKPTDLSLRSVGKCLAAFTFINRARTRVTSNPKWLQSHICRGSECDGGICVLLALMVISVLDASTVTSGLLDLLNASSLMGRRINQYFLNGDMVIHQPVQWFHRAHLKSVLQGSTADSQEQRKHQIPTCAYITFFLSV